MTASNAFGGKDVNVLLYLARAWYALANRESNFSAMNKALDYCQEVSNKISPQSCEATDPALRPCISIPPIVPFFTTLP